MEFLPYNFIFMILQNDKPTTEAWIPVISALSGAFIGGISTSLVCYYTIKKEREKEILLHKITLLDGVSKNFLIPFLEYRHELALTKDPDKINELRMFLRNNRSQFLYCPNNIKRRLNDLYMEIEDKNAVFDEEKIKEIISDIDEIENEYYSSFIEMRI